MYADALVGIEKNVAVLVIKPAVVATASAGTTPRFEMAATSVNATSKPLTPALLYQRSYFQEKTQF